MEIKQKILDLKTQKNAIILAHIYQRPEIQDIADYVGDSLGLSQKAAAVTDADMIVFCGVDFMAETAKILSPDKKVLVPDPSATCPMAKMITVDALIAKKKEYPNAAVVCYVNTDADIKAESDICCTSRNAVQVVESLSEKQIIFVPDKSLGAYVAELVPDKEFIFWEGYCPTHHRILAENIQALKKLHSAAKVASHPECTGDVLALSDFIGSTGAIQDYVARSEDKEFIIGSELGIIYRLEKDNPGKKFYHPTDLGICPNMKKNTLENLAEVLENERNEVVVDYVIAEKASQSIKRMLKV
ncbi:quinolinate synthase NadA [Candidatus Margulisiibacteriota bacterium]